MNAFVSVLQEKLKNGVFQPQGVPKAPFLLLLHSLLRTQEAMESFAFPYEFMMKLTKKYGQFLKLTDRAFFVKIEKLLVKITISTPYFGPLLGHPGTLV